MPFRIIGYDGAAYRSQLLDDRKENCEAAEKFGIHTIQFHNFKQAAAELEKMGVK